MKLTITGTIEEEELLFSINTLTDNEKADLAIRFGDGGDINYDLILLSKLIIKFSEIYPLNCAEDIEMTNIVNSLLNLKPSIDNLIN